MGQTVDEFFTDIAESSNEGAKLPNWYDIFALTIIYTFLNILNIGVASFIWNFIVVLIHRTDLSSVETGNLKFCSGMLRYVHVLLNAYFTQPCAIVARRNPCIAIQAQQVQLCLPEEED